MGLKPNSRLYPSVTTGQQVLEKWSFVQRDSCFRASPYAPSIISRGAEWGKGPGAVGMYTEFERGKNRRIFFSKIYLLGIKLRIYLFFVLPFRDVYLKKCISRN